MLNHATQYALIALLHLARSEPNLRSVPSIAATERIPRKFLQHIMTDLRKAGLVTSIEGHNGGYRLARPATAISIADVLKAMVLAQREQRLALIGGEYHERTEKREAVDAANTVVARAYDNLYANLGMTSLHDLISIDVTS